jgi:hypothetical protein
VPQSVYLREALDDLPAQYQVKVSGGRAKK